MKVRFYTQPNRGSRGGAPGEPRPLFWVQKEEITQERKAGRASKTKPSSLCHPPPPPAQGLDPTILTHIQFKPESPKIRNSTRPNFIFKNKHFDQLYYRLVLTNGIALI